MFEDFREQGSSFLDETEEEGLGEAPSKPEAPRGRFLGMTPVQRFIIAAMLLTLTCLLSAFCLLVTQKVVPPFLY
jgi:hypothetical protein